MGLCDAIVEVGDDRVVLESVTVAAPEPRDD
jgi:hypothetical protein